MQGWVDNSGKKEQGWACKQEQACRWVWGQVLGQVCMLAQEMAYKRGREQAYGLLLGKQTLLHTSHRQHIHLLHLRCKTQFVHDHQANWHGILQLYRNCHGSPLDWNLRRCIHLSLHKKTCRREQQKGGNLHWEWGNQWQMPKQQQWGQTVVRKGLTQILMYFPLNSILPF